MPNKNKRAPSPAWENNLPTRLRLERYPYAEADGDLDRIDCVETEFWRCDVANELLHDLFLMCHAAETNHSDSDALSCWLDSVFIQILSVHQLDDCCCEASCGNAIDCVCETRVNKPNEKDNASARLALLQVLGLICPTAGFIMSNNDVLQTLLATKDEVADGVNCDQLSIAFKRVKMQDSLGMGFVDKNHVALVNVDCMTVRATVSYLMLDANQFQKSRAVRMPLQLAAPMGEACSQAWQLPQIVSQVLHHVHEDIRQREDQNPNGEYLMQNPGVDASKMLWFRAKTEPVEQWVQVQSMTHLLALHAEAGNIVGSWDVSACWPEIDADVALARPKLKPIDARPVLYLHYGMDPRWLEKMTLRNQMCVLNMSTAHSLLTAKNVPGDGNCLLHALVQTWKRCNPGKPVPWHDADSLRKAVVGEMRQAPYKDCCENLMSGFDAETWGAMCD